jgi:HSP20 family molecular chaperone IbpA
MSAITKLRARNYPGSLPTTKQRSLASSNLGHLESFDSIWNWFHEPVQTYSRKESVFGNARIADAKTYYKLIVDLPGLTNECVQVDLKDEKLLVEAKKPLADNEEKLIYGAEPETDVRLEFRLPKTANLDSVTAKVENGRLEVVVKKTPAAETRSIPIE